MNVTYPAGLADPRLNARNLFPNQPAQPQPQPVVTVKPSKIPSRGARELRTPLRLEDDMKTREYPANAPVLNEMLSYTPRVVKMEEKVLTDRLITEEEQKQRKRIDDFFSSICCPPQSLPLPDDPVITPLEQVVIHEDIIPNGVGPILTCKEMTNVPAFNPDPGAAVMRIKTMTRT